MNWHFWEKLGGGEKSDEGLPLYEPSSKPTRILKGGKPIAGKGAAKVREHFLKMDSEAYDGLLKKVFEPNGGTGEIDEVSYSIYRDDQLPHKGEVFVFRLTTNNGLMVNLMSNTNYDDVITWTLNGEFPKGDRYELRKYNKNYYEFFASEMGSYTFSGKLKEADYRELIEPNAMTGKNQITHEPMTLCSRGEDGGSWGVIREKVVPELMKRIISYASER